MNPLIGQIMMFGGNFAPLDWALCNGQLLPIASNEALFSILGTTYGGDGINTFALPDLRGRLSVHPGNGPGLYPRTLGESGGTESNSLTVTQIPSHSHVLNAKEEANSDNPTGNYIAGSGTSSFGTTSGVQMAGTSLGPVGGNQPVANMQPFECVNYIIALVGIYPSRN